MQVAEYMRAYTHITSWSVEIPWWGFSCEETGLWWCFNAKVSLIGGIFLMFLDSRDRLNRKGETARSLEDYRMSMIWWVFFRLRIWCFVPYSLPLIYFKVTSHLQRPKKSIFILFDKTEFKHLTLPFTHSETVWFMEDLAVIIALNHSFLSEIISLSLGEK